MIRRHWVWLAVALGCLVGSSCTKVLAEPPAPSEPSWLLMRIDTVRVAGQRAGKRGSWDDAREQEDGDAGCELLSLAAGAMSGGTAATATNLLCRLAGDGGDGQVQKDPKAPDLLIKIAAGPGIVYRTYIAGDTYSHMFLYPVAVPLAAIPRGGLQIAVLDQDGSDMDDGELIGSVRVPRAQLVRAAMGASPVLTLADGPLKKLELTVEPHPASPRLGAHVHPVAEPLAEMASLRVNAGELVELRASGRYSVASNGEQLGPEGYRNGSRRGYNLSGPAFARVAHGAAVARVGRAGASINVAVDGCIRFISPFAGTVQVGVNDSDRYNNEGVLSFEAVVGTPKPEDWVHAGLVFACPELDRVEIVEE